MAVKGFNSDAGTGSVTKKLGKASPGTKTKIGVTATKPKTPPAQKIEPPKIKPDPNPYLPAGTGIGGLGAAGVSGSPTNPTLASTVDPSSQYPEGDPSGWTGFASRYAPGSAQTLYDNPQIIANDVLSSLGFGNNSALQGMYSDVAANAIPLAQLLGAISGVGNDASTFNTAADYLTQMATPGGSVPDAAYLVEQLLNPTGILAEYLNPVGAGGQRMTADQQLSLLLPYFQAATQGLNPLFQRALGSALNRGALDLNTAGSHGEDVAGTSFVDFLRQGGYVPEFR